MTPVASIALATFNGGTFLRKQLGSLLNQEYSPIEIIISDDGSTDDTLSILEEYSKTYSTVRWYKNPRPCGYIKNFEYAISKCTGDIIFLCDQDDVWYSDKVSSHMEKYIDPHISWIYSRVVLVDEEDRKIGSLEDTSPDYWKKRTLLQNAWGSCILGCATSYRAIDLHKILPSSDFARAHDSWIQFALFPKKSLSIDKVLQEYRLHNSNTAGWNKKPSKEQEATSLASYLLFLKDIQNCKNIALWKRMFFGLFYVVKLLRDKAR